MEPLADLLVRVEAATGPDRELDALILQATNPHRDGPYSSWRATASAFGWNTDVTSSLDAALALVERVLPGWTWSADSGRAEKAWPTDDPRPHGCVRSPEGRPWSCGGATPALALLAALLRALSVQPDAALADAEGHIRNSTGGPQLPSKDSSNG